MQSVTHSINPVSRISQHLEESDVEFTDLAQQLFQNHFYQPHDKTISSPCLLDLPQTCSNSISTRPYHFSSTRTFHGSRKIAFNTLRGKIGSRTNTGKVFFSPSLQQIKAKKADSIKPSYLAHSTKDRAQVHNSNRKYQIPEVFGILHALSINESSFQAFFHGVLASLFRFQIRWSCQ